MSAKANFEDLKYHVTTDAMLFASCGSSLTLLRLPCPRSAGTQIYDDGLRWQDVRHGYNSAHKCYDHALMGCQMFQGGA